MLKTLVIIFDLFTNIFKSKKKLLIENAVLKKQLEILTRKNKKQIRTDRSDRIIFSILNQIHDIRENFMILKPETLLVWQKKLRKHFWTFNKKKYPGRPPVSKEIRELVLKMKNSNLNLGVRRIKGELLKIGIDIDHKTVWNILRDYRKKGMVKSNLTWKKFLKSHAESIFAMDFFTIDSLFNKRFYVYFIIHHKTREIIQFAVTENPIKEFVRQQLILFKEEFTEKTYMIHDRTGEFIQNYVSLGIENIRISVKAPDIIVTLKG